MNQAAETISKSITNEIGEVIFLNGKAYIIKPVLTKTLCNIMKYWGKINIPSGVTNLNIIGLIPSNSEYILKGIREAIIGDSFVKRFQVRKLKATTKELKEALPVLIDLIGSEDFFLCATQVAEMTKIVAK